MNKIWEVVLNVTICVLPANLSNWRIHISKQIQMGQLFDSLTVLLHQNELLLSREEN